MSSRKKEFDRLLLRGVRHCRDSLRGLLPGRRGGADLVPRRDRPARAGYRELDLATQPTNTLDRAEYDLTVLSARPSSWQFF
ncbi:MAG: hypothetical protein AAB416_04215 [Patescibacteria group bacterium]